MYNLKQAHIIPVDILRKILFELKDQNYLYHAFTVKNNH